MAKLPAPVLKQIKDAVKAFEKKRTDFETDAITLQNRLLANADLKKLIHSLKWRAKDPTHLQDKLERKAHKAIEQGRAFDITADSLFDKIPDLAGVRLLHLHMRQIEEIHPLIIKVVADEGYVLNGEP